ncbi:MAG: iron-containing alcohol dehydrogenase [Acidobacteriota bacterium]
MIPFDFQLRTRGVFERGSIERLGQLARDLRFERTLLVADDGLVQAGQVASAMRLLEAAGVEAVPFHDFGVNPDSEMVEAGRQFAEPLGVDSIVGLGGGSSLDCAKGINLYNVPPRPKHRRRSGTGRDWFRWRGVDGQDPGSSG